MIENGNGGVGIFAGRSGGLGCPRVLGSIKYVDIVRVGIISTRDIYRIEELRREALRILTIERWSAMPGDGICGGILAPLVPLSQIIVSPVDPKR